MDAYSQFQHGNQPHGVTYHCVHQLWLLLAQSDKNMPAKLRRKQYLHIFTRFLIFNFGGEGTCMLSHIVAQLPVFFAFSNNFAVKLRIFVG
jgi:hypothetical protein